MTAVHSSPDARGVLRCDHCGRPVSVTRHTRFAYRVDYYSLHTGEVEATTLKTDDERESITVQKLLTAVDVITCVDCYRQPAVQADRERRFRPERYAVVAAEVQP